MCHISFPGLLSNGNFFSLKRSSHQAIISLMDCSQIVQFPFITQTTVLSHSCHTQFALIFSALFCAYFVMWLKSWEVCDNRLELVDSRAPVWHVVTILTPRVSIPWRVSIVSPATMTCLLAVSRASLSRGMGHLSQTVPRKYLHSCDMQHRSIYLYCSSNQTLANPLTRKAAMNTERIQISLVHCLLRHYREFQSVLYCLWAVLCWSGVNGVIVCCIGVLFYWEQRHKR